MTLRKHGKTNKRAGIEIRPHTQYRMGNCTLTPQLTDKQKLWQ